MSDVKPRIEPARVASLLQESFGAPARNLELLHGGQISAAYGCTVRDRGYVVRISPAYSLPGFEKDRYVSRHFASDRLPVPTVIQIGQVDDLYYAISEKMPGQRVNALSPTEFTRVIPSLLDTLDAVHAVDVRGTRGFGAFDSNGVGGAETWRADLISGWGAHGPGTFYGDWHQLFTDSFLERGLFDAIYERMVRLLDDCPEERHLVHGDYGFGNVLAENGRVTAVLDWANAVYGDFVHDLAWLDFQLPQHSFYARFCQRFAEQNRIVPNFRERMLCYQCGIALDNMRYNAKIGNEVEYRRAVDRIRRRFPEGLG